MSAFSVEMMTHPEAATFGLNQKVTKCATDLQDQQLLAKLSGGDLVAQYVKCHLGCLVSLYNRAAAEQARKANRTQLTISAEALLSIANIHQWMKDG